MSKTLLLLPFLLSLPSFAAENIYGDVSDVEGDVLVGGFEGSINVLSVSSSFAADPAARRVTPAPVVITKNVDIATPKLMSMGASLSPIKSVTLSMIDLENQLYMEVRLDNAVITEWLMVENAGIGGPGIEQVSFSAEKVSLDVTPYDASGRAERPISGSFSAL